jgi:hypothetical protein
MSDNEDRIDYRLYALLVPLLLFQQQFHSKIKKIATKHVVLLNRKFLQEASKNYLSNCFINSVQLLLSVKIF